MQICSCGGWSEVAGNQKKDPESWNVRGTQDSIGMTLAKMPKSGEVEPEETTSSS